MSGLRVLAALVVANRLAGGVVGFQLALQFFYLPVAVCARPVAVALLPRLSRLHRDGLQQRFRRELERGAALCLFVAIPASLAITVLALPIARAVSLGRMGNSAGVSLIALSLASVGFGVLGESAFVLATHASFARQDPYSPLRSMQLQTVSALGGLTAVFLLVHGPPVLAGIGLSITVSGLLGAGHLVVRLRALLPPGEELLPRSVLRALAASIVMLVPALLLATFVPRVLGGEHSHRVARLAAGSVGALTYLGAQRAMRSPELGSLLARRERQPATDPVGGGPGPSPPEF
jgi:putative peptidoglycan lipid II flippase